MESEDSDPEMYITKSSLLCENNLSDNSNAEEILNAGENGEMQDITIDEVEHVADTRFAKPVSDSEIRSKIGDSVPKSAKCTDKWAVNLYESWREQRNLRVWNSRGSKYPDLQTIKNSYVMSDEELNHTLSSFVHRTRDKSVRYSVCLKSCKRTQKGRKPY